MQNAKICGVGNKGRGGMKDEVFDWGLVNLLYVGS